MSNESKVSAIWGRPGVIVSIAGCLVVMFALICAYEFHGAEKRLGEEHAARVDAESTLQDLQKRNDQLVTALKSSTQMYLSCSQQSSKQFNDSMDRLKTRTILVTSLPETPQNGKVSLLPAAASLPVLMQRAGLLGLLMDVVQASQKQTGHAQPPAQVWILPTSIEPMFAGDVDRAWVIHADAQSGRSIDAPHHPFPVQAQQ